jgi:transcriptional regulator with XRE-family HTH domain
LNPKKFIIMDFGNLVSELRKQKGISQTDLATRLAIHKNVLGRYERNEVFPSIDIARKIADILDVSLDYLTGKDDVQIDKTASTRILEVSKFEEQDRNHIYSVIDAFIAKRKIQSIL